MQPAFSAWPKNTLAVFSILAGHLFATPWIAAEEGFSATGFVARGDEHFRRRQYAEAVEQYTAAIAIEPALVVAICHRAFALLRSDQFEAALRDFNRAIELDPKSWESHAGRAEVRAANKDYTAALADAETALQLNPQSAPAYRLRSLIRFQLGRHGEAMNDAARAAELDPRLQPLTRNLEHVLGRPLLAVDSGGHSISCMDMAFLPDGRQLVTVSNDKTIRFWDTASGEPLRVLRPPASLTGGHLFAVAVSPGGEWLAVAGKSVHQSGKIYLLSLDQGRIERVLEGHSAYVVNLAFSPDGRLLASGGGDKTARIWSVADGRALATFAGHDELIYAMAFSPDGKRLATASYDGAAKIWSLPSGPSIATLLKHDGEVRSIVFSPAGDGLATSGTDGFVRTWNLDGSPRRSYELGGQVTSIAYTTDAQQLLFVHVDRGRALPSGLLNLQTGRIDLSFEEHASGSSKVALSPDGTHAATAGAFDPDIVLLDISTGKVLHRMVGKGRLVWSVGWSPDGKSIAWGPKGSRGNGGENAPEDSATWPLDCAFHLEKLELSGPPQAPYRRGETSRGSLSIERRGLNAFVVKDAGRFVCTRELDRNSVIHSMTMLPDKQAVVSETFGLHLVDLRTGEDIHEFLDAASVLAVASSPDGKRLLTAGSDQTLRVWDPQRIEPLLSIFVAEDQWIAWTPEGYYACSPGGERLVGWHVNRGIDKLAAFYPAAQFRQSLYQPDVIRLISSSRSLAEALDAAYPNARERLDVAHLLPPTVEIVSPKSNSVELDQPALEVDAVAHSTGRHPVTALRLLVDGRPYQGRLGRKEIDSPRLGEARAKWTVTLDPGPHNLAVQAESAVSKGLSAERMVRVVGSSGAEQVALPDLYVLAVGISDYELPSLRLYYAASDAELLVTTVQRHCRPLFRRVETRLITDREATQRNVKRGLSWLAREMTQRDVGIVFFSCHGDKDAQGNFYLLPADVDAKDLPATAVPDAHLKRTIAATPGRLLVLLDACHAGAIGGDRRKSIGGLTDALVRDLVTDDFGAIVMAASMGREFSLESNRERQGYFTLALVEGLRGRADYDRDAAVYLNELDLYVTDRVKQLSRGRQHPVTQRPTTIRTFPLSKIEAAAD